jgi:hypothetical protein
MVVVPVLERVLMVAIPQYQAQDYQPLLLLVVEVEVQMIPLIPLILEVQEVGVEEHQQLVLLLVRETLQVQYQVKEIMVELLQLYHHSVVLEVVEQALLVVICHHLAFRHLVVLEQLLQ